MKIELECYLTALAPWERTGMRLKQDKDIKNMTERLNDKRERKN